MSAATGGVDVLAFTGGVGEHSAAVRRRAAGRLAFLGVAIDHQRNDMFHGDGPGEDGAGGASTGGASTGGDDGPADADITSAGATVRTLVITAREDLQIAREARRLLAAR